MVLQYSKASNAMRQLAQALYQGKHSMSASKYGTVCLHRTDKLHGQLERKALHFKYLNFTAEFQELFDMPLNIQPFTEVRCQPSQP